MSPVARAVRRGVGAAAVSLRFKTLPALLEYACETYDRRNALSYPDPATGWRTLSHAELREHVRRPALGLVDLGVERGDSVGLIAPSSPWWLVVDLAIQATGAVTGPLFKRISVESFTHEVNDSGACATFSWATPRRSRWLSSTPARA